MILIKLILLPFGKSDVGHGGRRPTFRGRWGGGGVMAMHGTAQKITCSIFRKRKICFPCCKVVFCGWKEECMHNIGKTYGTQHFFPHVRHNRQNRVGGCCTPHPGNVCAGASHPPTTPQQVGLRPPCPMCNFPKVRNIIVLLKI